MRMRPRGAAFVALVAFVAFACGGRRAPPPPAPTPVTAAEPAPPYVLAEVPALSRYELAFDLPDRKVHPDDVVIEAQFTSPSGKTMTVGGFSSHGRFVVRFTPREEEPHAFVVRADGGAGMSEIERGTLVAKRSDARGFVRSDREHRRLVDDRGRTVFVLGENRINVYDPAGALAHSAPQFQVDSDEPMTPERAAHFRVLSDFLSAFDPTLPLQPARDVQPSDPEAKVLSLTNPAGARAIWILGPRKTYGSPVKALRLKLPAPPKGAWLVTWIDDVTGKQLGRRAIDSPGKGDVTLDVPTFVRHVAARLLGR